MFTAPSSPYDVLHSTNEMAELTSNWQKENKSRVFAQTCLEKSMSTQTTSVTVHKVPLHVSTSSSPAMSHYTPAHTCPSAMASLKHVVNSRPDLPFNRNTHAPVLATTDAKPSPSRFVVNEHADKMCSIETKLIESVCEQFLHASPPYSFDTTDMGSKCDGSKDIVSHSCCAYVTPVHSTITRKFFLPVVAPSRSQIAQCVKDVEYNANVQRNITSALDTDTPFIFSSSSQCQESGAIHIDTSNPIKALGTTQCCEELLFGKTRITSSVGFCVCPEIGVTYAQAVHRYQPYGNVAVGDNITLVPVFHQRTPMVVSMSCPETNMTQTVTGLSSVQNHVKFGPDHTTQAVEVLRRLAPFVTQCCETYMKLPHETVEDLREDNDMPIAVCGPVEHCFAHNPAHGVSAYVAKHTFSIPTAILNTHTSNVVFPTEKKITVYVASLFGGAVTDTIHTPV